MLVRFAGASGDFSPHHYDQELGEKWFPGTGIILHGALKAAWLGQYATGWAVAEGVIWGTFDFTNPTGGEGRAVLTNEALPTAQRSWGDLKAEYRGG